MHQVDRKEMSVSLIPCENDRFEKPVVIRHLYA